LRHCAATPPIWVLPRLRNVAKLCVPTSSASAVPAHADASAPSIQPFQRSDRGRRRVVPFQTLGGLIGSSPSRGAAWFASPCPCRWTRHGWDTARSARCAPFAASSAAVAAAIGRGIASGSSGVSGRWRQPQPRPRNEQRSRDAQSRRSPTPPCAHACSNREGRPGAPRRLPPAPLWNAGGGDRPRPPCHRSSRSPGAVSWPALRKKSC